MKTKYTLRATVRVLSLSAALAPLGCGGAGSDIIDLNISPISPTILVTDTVQFAASATYNNGTMSDITGTGTWSSSAPSIASIQTNGQASPGLATGIAPGSCEITISLKKGSSTITGTTTLTVDAAGAIVEHPLEGVAPVYFRAFDGVSTSSFTLDGKPLADDTAHLTIPSGDHRLASSDGRYIFFVHINGYRSYTFALSPSGRITLDESNASTEPFPAR